MLGTGSERIVQQQPQGQQVQFEAGEKRYLENLVVKLNCQQYLSCSVGAPATEPVHVWARVGVGTRWLAAVEDAGCGKPGHPGGESFPPFAPDKGNNHRSCYQQLFLSGLWLDSRVIQQVVDFCCVKIHHVDCCRDI